MADPYSSTTDALTAQAESWASVTPDDDNDLAEVPKALFVGTAGDLALVGSDGVEVTFKVAVGYHPLRPRRVKDTNTTATGIVALYGRR